MNRRTFIRNTGLAGAAIAMSPLFDSAEDENFPLMDLHVHLTGNFTINDLMDIAKKTKVRFGVMVNPGYGINNDADLKRYIDSLLPYPVYIGLQPMSPGWSAAFSPETIARLDYVLMDAQTIPSGNGYNELLRIWNFDTYIDDTEAFMNKYMAHILEIINNNEPLNTLGWPLFLPVCIARDYYTLWTENRMQQIIAAAKKRNLNIEINDMAHTPHEKFIYMAKEQGLKFTFGSDTRDNKAGRLDYCRYIAKKCKLTRQDFFIPKRTLKS